MVILNRSYNRRYGGVSSGSTRKEKTSRLIAVNNIFDFRRFQYMSPDYCRRLRGKGTIQNAIVFRGD